MELEFKELLVLFVEFMTTVMLVDEELELLEAFKEVPLFAPELTALRVPIQFY